MNQKQLSFSAVVMTSMAGILPEDVFAEFENFYNSVKERLPKTMVFAISIQPSPKSI